MPSPVLTVTPAGVLQPLASVGGSPDTTVWRTLDEPGEWMEFSRDCPDRPGLLESGIAIEGMYCAGCSLKIEAALLAVPGVQAARVGAASGRARVTWSPGLTRPSQWLGAVQGAGYRPWPSSDTPVAALRQEQRQALWRWLVAGFCMMQVMMYSVPSYLAGPGEMTQDAVQLMRWASWVLTLPVLFFSCGPFFTAAWRDLWRGRVNMDLPVALGIAITFAVSSAATFDASGWWSREVWFDSLTMFVFFLLSGRWFELRLRGRTAGALDALMRRLPEAADCLQSDGSFVRTPVRRLKVGDVVRVRPGEAFPADATLLEGRTEVDEALLTGESRPLERTAGQAVLAGSYNLASAVQARVDRAGRDTRFAQIVELMELAALDKPRLALLADRIARPFLLLVLMAACGAAAWWWPSDPYRALMAAVAVLIVTCPCALSIATPAAMLASAGTLARGGVLLRNLNALESLAGVDTVVFDKTGTLTTDCLELTSVALREGEDSTRALKLAATLARASLHPVSRALAATSADSVHGMTQVEEVAGQGVQGLLYGERVRLGRAEFCGMPCADRSLAGVHLADVRGWLASFSLRESLRPEAGDVIKALQVRGLRVEILSGDDPIAVARIAGRLGVDQVRGGCSVQDKLDHVHALQAQGHRVAMVGDGFNDGPVLACADVSVALGNAVPLAQRRADCVMAHSDLRAVTSLVDQGRATLSIVRQNLLWAALYNLACVPLAVAGLLPAWLAGLGMALSSLMVVLNATRLVIERPGR